MLKLTRIFYVILWAALGATGVVAAQTSSSQPRGADPAAVNELRAALNTGDLEQIIAELNKVKRMPYKGEILPYIQSLWQADEQSDNRLDWTVAKLPIVKVELANVLLQANRNGFVKLDPTEYHDFALRHARSDDVALSRSAILTLSLTNDRNDVPLLFEIAKESNPGTFGAAVISLSYMCNSEAVRALDHLEQEASAEGPKGYLAGQTPREFIADTRAGAAPVRAFYGGDCE